MGHLFVQNVDKISCFENTIKIQPNNEDAHNNLGVVFKDLGEHEKAINCYKKAIEINPNYVNAYNNLGILLEELNHVDEAKKNLEISLNLDPNKEKTCEVYGNILLKLNQHLKALEYIKKGSGFIRFTQKDFKII